MAVLSPAEEPGGVGEADACQYVRFRFSLTCVFVGRLIVCMYACSVRFAPPLVIAEEDLLRAVKIIGECLTDLDEVGSFLPLLFLWSVG